jgi:hypothetical protein
MSQLILTPNTPLLDRLEDLTIADAWFIELLGPGLFAVEDGSLPSGVVPQVVRV